jgi:hypothetical protein
MEKCGRDAVQVRQDNEKMVAANQTRQDNGVGVLHRRAGEKRRRTGEDRVEQLKFIKFGSFSVTSTPVGLQRCAGR